MKTILIEGQRADEPVRPLSDWNSVVSEEEKRNVSLAGPLIVGFATLVFGLGSFVAWAALTPLAQAAVASGRIIVESKTKTVTHLEGGTLVELLVKEGDKVVEQQPLAKLDVTRSQAALTQLSEQLFSTKLRFARLTAERDGKPDFDIPDAAGSSVTPQYAERVVGNERRVMRERAAFLRDQLAIDASLIEQVTRQREAVSLRIGSLSEQLVTAQNDYTTLSGLAAKGLATRAQVSEAKLLLSDIESQLLQYKSQLSEGQEKEKQYVLNRASRQSENQRIIAEELQAAQIEIARLTQEIVAAQDIVSKSVLRAPQDGVVANIRVRTPGSALIPGTPFLDIVPDNQPKIVEGRARASDIETLQLGQLAEIRLSAFSAAEAQPLMGVITYLAPDSTIDERTGEITFAFKAQIPDEELLKQPKIVLHPGMAADVFIVSGNRTALSYLLLPVKQSFAKAFRED